MIILLNQLNSEQIERYDDLFVSICKGFIDEFENIDIPNNYETEISDSRINTLIKCTNALNIPTDEHALIINNVKRLIKGIEPYLSPLTLDLMFPVFFFAAVLQNESNSNTIIQRKLRGTKNWGRTNNLLTSVEGLFDQKHGEQETTFKKKCNELEALYSRYINNINNSDIVVLTELDEHVQNALALKESYSDINKIQNQAKIGFFALKILDAEHSPVAPMMTLARMYVIDHICKLDVFEAISNGFPMSTVDSGSLISRFYYNDEPYMERQLSKHGLGYLRKMKKTDRIDLSKLKDVFSEEYCENLKKVCTLRQREELLFGTVLSDQEVLAIKDYYLNKCQLEWYADFYAKIMEYLHDIIEIMKRVTHIRDRYSNKEMYTSFLNPKIKEN